MKFDLDNVRDLLGHKFSSYSVGSFHHVCDICHIMIYFVDDNSVVLVNKVTYYLDYNSEILDCKTQQIKNLLE